MHFLSLGAKGVRNTLLVLPVLMLVAFTVYSQVPDQVILTSAGEPHHTSEEDLLLEGVSLASNQHVDWRVDGNSHAALHMPLSDASVDISSNGLHGVATGGTYISTQGRDAYVFDGIASQITITDEEDVLDPYTSDFTYEAWILPEDKNHRSYVFGKRNPAAPYDQWGMGIFDGQTSYGAGKKLVCTFGSAYGYFHHVATVADIVDGQWHHVACRVRYGAGIDIFVDGQLATAVNLGDEAWEPLEVPARTIIGSGNGDYFYEGAVHAVKVYKHAVSAEQIALNASEALSIAKHETVSGQHWYARLAEYATLDVKYRDSNVLFVEDGNERPDAYELESTTTTFQANADVRLKGISYTPGQIIDWRKDTVSFARLHVPFEHGIANVSTYGVHVSAPTFTLVPDESGGEAYEFDGVSEVTLTSDQLDPKSGDWTMEAWVKPENQNQRGYVMSKRTNGGSYAQWGMGFFDGSINYGSGKKLVCTYGWVPGYFHDVATVSDVVDDKWHHVVCRVRAGEGIDIFVDGKKVQSTVLRNESWGSLTIAADASIGSGNGTFYYDGLVADARVYDRALSDHQIVYHDQKQYHVLAADEIEEGDVWSSAVIEHSDGATIVSASAESPQIVAYSPTRTVQWLTHNGSKSFSIDMCMSQADETISYEWLLDAQVVGTGQSFVLDASSVSSSVYALVGRCKNDAGQHDEITFSVEVLHEDDFAVIAPSNVQTLSEYYPSISLAQTQWIVDAKDDLNTAFVTYSGDVVNAGDSHAQWQTLDSSLSLMDGVLPYAISIGNHDYDDTLVGDNMDFRSSTMFNTYFPLSRYENETWWGGQQGSSTINTYQFFDEGGVEYAFFHLEFCPSSSTLDWAGQILDQYPDKKAIITTHVYLNHDDTYVESGDPYNCEGFLDPSYVQGVDKNNGDEVWDKFVRLHDNIILVLSGHVIGDGAGFRTDLGVGGNVVNQIFHNSFALIPGNNGGESAYTRIYIFSPSENEVRVRTYGPWLDELKLDTQNNFSFSHNFSS